MNWASSILADIDFPPHVWLFLCFLCCGMPLIGLGWLILFVGAFRKHLGKEANPNTTERPEGSQ